jgi:hypothetical protein
MRKLVNLAGIGLTVDDVYDKIATYLAPDLAIRPNHMSTVDSRLCHLRTARAITERREGTDLVWLYGLQGLGVWHSVLTSKSQDIIVGGHYGLDTHKFLAKDGFQITPGNVLELLNCMSVTDLCLKYHTR